MSAYALKNFFDTHDRLADDADREIRFLREELGARDIGITYLAIGPNYRSEMGHHHREQEEGYAVVQGSGKVKLDDEILELKQWDVLRVSPEVTRAFEGGPEGMVIVAVGGPKPEGGDGVRVEGFWPAD